MVLIMLEDEDRETLEEAIFDAHHAAQKYVNTGKDIHYKMLEISVKDALDLIETVSEELKKDEMSDNYKLHMLVPLQIIKLVEERNES